MGSSASPPTDPNAALVTSLSGGVPLGTPTATGTTGTAAVGASTQANAVAAAAAAALGGPLPTYNAPGMTPLFGSSYAQAQQLDIAALQQQAQFDSASLLARYGTNLALAGRAGSPLA